MYASRTTQFIVGLFALLGVMALAILSFRLGRVTILPTPGYLLYANFDNISGLKPGDEIDIAGVKVGSVSGATLQGNQAHVTLHLNKGVEVDDDAIASIKSSGIIGGKYVSIALGGGEKTLQNGDTIRQTESAFILENAIGQFINNIGQGGGNKENQGAGSGIPGAGANQLPSGGDAKTPCTPCPGQKKK
jgi:phospholipid/cholesterol/gamma-HCH transport system substrate-binding protein